MTFINQIQHRFTGFEENFNLPAFSINADDIFFGESRICTDNSKPILPIRFQPCIEGSIQQGQHCFQYFYLVKIASFTCNGSVIKVFYWTGLYLYLLLMLIGSCLQEPVLLCIYILLPTKCC